MDRNTVIGLVLIVGIVVIYFFMTGESAEERDARIAQQRELFVQDSTAKANALILKDSIAKIEENVDDTFIALKDSAGIIQLDSTGKAIADSAAMEAAKIEAVEKIAATAKVDSGAYFKVLAKNPDLLPEKDSVAFWSIYDSIFKADLLVRKADENKARLDKKYGIFAPAAKNKEKKYFTIENAKVKLKIASIGGQIAEAHVKNYKSYHDYKNDSSETPNSIQLFDEDSTSQALRLRNSEFDSINTLDLNFEVAEATESSVRLRAKTADPEKYLEYHYYFSDTASYTANYDINFVGLHDKLDPNKMDLRWSMKGLSTEKLASQERTICGVMYKCKGDGRDYLNERGADEETEFGTDLEWIAFKHNYFSSILYADAPFTKNDARLVVEDQVGNKYTTRYLAEVSVAKPLEKSTTVPLKMYFGPNDYKELAKLDMEAEDLVNLGPSVFRVVNKYFIIPIFDLLKGTGLGYGLIIVLMTLIIKIVILPLTYKNYKSSAKMRILKPEIEKINAKYPEKEDAVKKQQETMALYKKSGASPMAGCIPMLIQMPILFAAFRFFPSSMDLRQQSFLWADDLSAYDAIFTWDAQIPLLSSFYGNHVSLFTILMCVSTIFYTRLNSSQMSQGQPGMPNMKVIMYIFPIFMLFIFNSFAAGLSLYYLCGNVMNMGLMWMVKKYFIDEDKLRAKMAEKSAKPAKQSKFQARLADMAKQQQERQKQQGRR